MRSVDFGSCEVQNHLGSLAQEPLDLYTVLAESAPSVETEVWIFGHSDHAPCETGVAPTCYCLSNAVCIYI